MTQDRDRRPSVPSVYVYRRPLAGRDLLPALGVGLAVGLGAFYVARLFLQRTPLEPAMNERPRQLRRAVD